MASCDWKKLKGGTETKAVFAHCESEQRLEREHANTDINKARTWMNKPLGAFQDGYKGLCKAYDEFIAELDKAPNANKRRDRVTCVGLEIPVPANMPDDVSMRWLEDAYGVVCERLGYTVLGGVTHLDEIHDYRDPETKEVRTSRPHVHVYCVPEVDGKLNAKTYTNRRAMMAMNTALEKMTSERYPGYRFQTGTKKKSRKSVAELKAESDYAEIIFQAEEEAARIKATAEAEVNASREAAEAVLRDAEKKAEEIMSEARKTAQKASEDVQRLSSAMQRLKAVEAAYLEELKGLQDKKAEEARQAALQRQAEEARREALRARRGHEFDDMFDRWNQTYTDKQFGE